MCLLGGGCGRDAGVAVAGARRKRGISFRARSRASLRGPGWLHYVGRPFFDVVDEEAGVAEGVDVGLEGAVEVRGGGGGFAMGGEAGVGLDVDFGCWRGIGGWFGVVSRCWGRVGCCGGGRDVASPCGGTWWSERF